MPLLLIAVGAVVALLFIVNAFVQTFRSRPKLGFWHTFLAFLAGLMPFIGLVNANMEPAQSTPAASRALANLPLGSRVVLGIAVVLVILSLIVLLLELRRPEKLKASRGVFGVGVGLLLAIAVFVVPTFSTRILQPAFATPTPIDVAAVRATNAPPTIAAAQVVTTVTQTPSPTLTPTATATRVRPTPIPTATRYRFATRTPAPTATLPNPCLALTNYNLNLRALPDAEGEVLGTIPYNTTITLFGRDEDSLWWFTQYENQGGWVKGEFINLTASCADLPVRPAS